MGDRLELNCPGCGIVCDPGDHFCRKCGARLRPGADSQLTPFEMEIRALLEMLREFRAWIDENRKKNVRFMKAYKERMENEIAPSVRAFDAKYRDRAEGQSPLFTLITEAFSVLRRPISHMETKLRPSVGMGVFLERWMMGNVVERYLRECCQEVDGNFEALTERLESSSDPMGHGSSM